MHQNHPGHLSITTPPYNIRLGGEVVVTDTCSARIGRPAISSLSCLLFKDGKGIASLSVTVIASFLMHIKRLFAFYSCKLTRFGHCKGMGKKQIHALMRIIRALDPSITHLTYMYDSAADYRSINPHNSMHSQNARTVVYVIAFVRTHRSIGNLDDIFISRDVGFLNCWSDFFVVTLSYMTSLLEALSALRSAYGVIDLLHSPRITHPVKCKTIWQPYRIPIITLKYAVWS